MTQFLCFLMFGILISDIISEYQLVTPTLRKVTKNSVKDDFKNVTLHSTDKHGDDIKTGEDYYPWLQFTIVISALCGGLILTYICILSWRDINRRLINFWNRLRQWRLRRDQPDIPEQIQLSGRIIRMDQSHVD